MNSELKIGAEDRFIVLGIQRAAAEIADPFLRESFAEVVHSLSLTPVFDFSGIAGIYNDVADLVGEMINPELQGPPMFVVGCEREREMVAHYFGHAPVIVDREMPNMAYEYFDLSKIGEEAIVEGLMATGSLEYDRNALSLTDDSLVGYKDAQDRELRVFLDAVGRNSLLVDYVLSLDGEGVAVTPYHSHAVFESRAPGGDQVIIAKPGVIAHSVRALLSTEIAELEVMLSKSTVKEAEIQSFLEEHPGFLTSMGYLSVFPQVTLSSERYGLRPDFICQPVGEEWCDIVELKLPIKNSAVGRGDRLRFSAAVTEGISQLREYAAWFEDPKNFRSFRKKYGLSVYKPRLRLIVGRDARASNELELRRLMTSYQDMRLEIVSFDKLIRIARTRLLI